MNGRLFSRDANTAFSIGGRDTNHDYDDDDDDDDNDYGNLVSDGGGDQEKKTWTVLLKLQKHFIFWQFFFTRKGELKTTSSRFETHEKRW